MAILSWLKLQLGHFTLDIVKEFGQILAAQQADLGAHALPEHEKAQEQKLAIVAELRKKTTNTLDLAALIMRDPSVQIQGRMIQR